MRRVKNLTIRITLALLMLCGCTARQSDKVIFESTTPVKVEQNEDGLIMVELKPISINNGVPITRTETVKISTTEEKEDSSSIFDGLSNLMSKTSGLVGWIALIIVSL